MMTFSLNAADLDALSVHVERRPGVLPSVRAPGAHPTPACVHLTSLQNRLAGGAHWIVRLSLSEEVSCAHLDPSRLPAAPFPFPSGAPDHPLRTTRSTVPSGPHWC